MMLRSLFLSRIQSYNLLSFGNRFNSTLLIAEHTNTDIASSTANVLSACKKIGNSVIGLVVGVGCSEAAKKLSNLSGFSKVIVADDTKVEGNLVEPVSDIICHLNQKSSFQHIVAAASASGKSLIPRVAAKLGVGALSDVIGVNSPTEFVRTIYAGNAVQTLQSLESIHCMTIRTTAFDPCETAGESASAVIEKFDVPSTLASDKSKFLGQELKKSDRPELPSAKIVISGGRGMKSGDNFKMLYELADIMKAAVGASRAAVDAGYVSNDLQVGQTGKIVAPDLYIAVGISGAIQHLAGMKDSKLIVAINKDAEAPIFQVADLGLVDDLFKAIPHMISKMK